MSRFDFLKPVDIAPLVLFRIAFGAIMIWEVWRYFHFDRINRYFIQPEFTFTYFGFAWVRPLPGDGMIGLFYFIGLLSALIMVGLFYRASMFLFFLCFSYVFLLDMAQYLNHFYLISLISFLMIFVPAHRAFSLDALLRPGLRAQAVPAWTLWLLRGQFIVIYIYAGVAKLNADWLRGEPMRLWLSERMDFPVIGSLFTEEWLVYAMSYGGLLFDLLVIPLIFWRRTRWLAVAAAVVFHLMNARLFNIGVFPWFALAATVLFLPPHWLRFRWLGRDNGERRAAAPLQNVNGFILAVMGIYFAVQIALPLRHFLYPGDVNWTEEGHKFAWHMRLRSKDGEARFYITDRQTGQTREVNPLDHLNQRQYSQMAGRPEMTLEFAHYLSDQHDGAAVRVWNPVSLNGRAPQLMVDPSVDLTQQSRSLQPASWILPLRQPLKGEAGVLLLLRDRGSFYLVNIANADFPLADLEIGLNWELETLPPGGCVSAHVEPAQPALTVICNEMGLRLQAAADHAIWQESLDVYLGETLLTHCTGRRCLITNP